MARLRLSGDFDYTFLAKSTPGYVGADLSALTGAAGVIAVKRIFEQIGDDIPTGITEVDGDEEMAVDDEEALPEAPTPPTTKDGKDTSNALALFSSLPTSLAALPIASFLQSHPHSLTPEQLVTLSLTNADFTSALTVVQPSSQREGFTTVPDVTWADLGALKAIREEMRMSIVRPIRRPEVFASLGIQAPCGVLLWGPPGCGKTLLAKAVANESRANFISVKGPELLNKVRLHLGHCVFLLLVVLILPGYSTSEKAKGLFARSLLERGHLLPASSFSTSSTPWFPAATTPSFVSLLCSRPL